MKISTRITTIVAGLATTGLLLTPVVMAESASASPDRHSHHAEPGHRHHAEPGHRHHAEPGDDHSHHAEPGDDNGHHGSRHS